MSKKKEISKEVRESLESIGLNEQNIQNYSKNEKTVQYIIEGIKESGAKDLIKVGPLLIIVATKCKVNEHRTFLYQYIGKGKEYF
jgi:hypothetical protein